MAVLPFKVIYKDEDIIVIDKPSGLLVVPTPKKEKHTLVHILNEFLKSKNLSPASPVHRIDRETSGIIIFAFNKNSLERLTLQFRHHTIKRIYLAVVQGYVQEKKGKVDIPLATDPNTHKVLATRSTIASQPSVTLYRVLQYLPDLTLLEIQPQTGRTNQIRVHLAYIGHPVVGERKYAIANRYPVKFRRVALHSSKLEIRHPKTGRIMAFKSPLPKDIKTLIEGK